MKFLILSNDYTGEIIYKRLEKEGNECLLYNPYHRNNGISSIASIGVAIKDKPELAVVCNSTFLKESELLRACHIKVFGGTLFQDKIELDKEVMKRLCKTYKIRLLKETTNIECPLSTEVWFSNGEPLYQYFGYIKQSKFLAGDLGPTVDCESILYWGYENRGAEPVKRIFENGLFDALKLIKYSGVMAFDAYISADDMYPYVENIRCYPTAFSTAAFLSLYDSALSDLLINISEGKSVNLLVQDKLALALTLSVPPYPYSYKGFVKYLVASDHSWLRARDNIAQQIKELDIPQLQYRIDGGIQGKDYDKLREMSYLN